MQKENLEEIVLRSFGTHDGSFHADEVTSCALLLLYNCIDENKIYRTRDHKILDKCEYVCDVGGLYDSKKKRFDHHQKDYVGDLSSAGMILLYLKSQGLIDQGLYDYFNQTLIKGVDAHDIGKVKLEPGTCSFSQIIANFLPIEYEAKFQAVNESFKEALVFVLGHLERSRDRYFYTLKCKEKVKAYMETKSKCLVFSESIPWMDSFFALGGKYHPALFVIMPTEKHWKLRGIPPDFDNKMQVRLPLPLEWAGLHDEDLRTTSKLPGAIFCHKGRFISIWETKEDAIRALKYVLEKAGIRYENNI
jgi:uncharacterized UPF0160 family protein